MVADSQLCHLSPSERERSDRERAAEFTMLDWVQETAENMFLVENQVGAASWNQLAIRKPRNAPFEDISHLCMFGVKDPRSRKASRDPSCI